MEKNTTNLLLFLGICFIVYIIFRNLNYKEGMTDASGNTTASSTPTTPSGAAGNASNYASTIKNASVKLQDMLLTSKYRSTYETVILNLDDYVNNLMLSTALSVDPKNPLKTIHALNELNNSKTALNAVMKYVDSQ
jgi:hypothetical protein